MSANPCTVAHEVLLSMGFSWQKYLCRLRFRSPGDLPDPGIKLGSPPLQADSLPSEPSSDGKFKVRAVQFYMITSKSQRMTDNLINQRAKQFEHPLDKRGWASNPNYLRDAQLSRHQMDIKTTKWYHYTYIQMTKWGTLAWLCIDCWSN